MAPSSLVSRAPQNAERKQAGDSSPRLQGSEIRQSS